MIYNTQDKKVFVFINLIFLENDYMNNYEPQNKVLFEEMQSNQIKRPPQLETILDRTMKSQSKVKFHYSLAIVEG